MNTARLAPCLTALLLAGCLTRDPHVGTFRDPFNGLRTDLIVDNPLPSGETDREKIWLNACRVFKTSTAYEFYLEVTYAATTEVGYLDIGPGDTLVLVADGKEMKFESHGSQNRRQKKDGLLNEGAIYRAQASDLRALAQAQRVTVRVLGKHRIVQREFGPGNFERFKSFVSHFVPESQ